MPDGRHRARAGRHRARARRAAAAAGARPDGRRAARARRASCSRCGRAAVETDAFRAAHRRRDRVPPGRCCGCSGSRSPRSPRRCCARARRGRRPRRAGDHDLPAPRRGRGRHALRAAAAGGLRRRSRPSCASATPTTLFSDDGTHGRRAGRRAAARPRPRTIATAESCTGGLLAGAADRARRARRTYVLGGLVVYSNEAKTALAGVDPALIARVGAVSVEVAEALADGAIARAGADVGVGITGIAGPGGGTRGQAGGHRVLLGGAARRPGRPAARRGACCCPAGASTSATARRPSRCTCVRRLLLGEADAPR